MRQVPRAIQIHSSPVQSIHVASDSYPFLSVHVQEEPASHEVQVNKQMRTM